MAERARSDTIQLKARMKEPLRAKLEEAAEARGVSLNAEMVHRLERSFEGDEALGGRELRALFHMMGAAAQIIEERTGQSCSVDYETSKVVRAAWAKLASNFAPRSGPDYFESFDLPPIGPEPPPAPEWPKYPRGRGLRSPPPSPEALKKYEKEVASHKKKFAKWEKATNERREKIETYLQHQKNLEELGREVATGLFPPREPEG